MWYRGLYIFLYVFLFVCVLARARARKHTQTHTHARARARARAPQESKQNGITVWYMLYDLGVNKSRASKFCMVPNIFSIITAFVLCTE
jgi:hypothetical protein